MPHGVRNVLGEIVVDDSALCAGLFPELAKLKEAQDGE